MTTKDYEQRLREINERERYLVEKEDYKMVPYGRLREINHDRINVTDRIGLLKTITWPYDTFDRPPDDKYFEAQKELTILESRLKNLNDKERMIENILESEGKHNPLPPVVPQGQGYEIPNGLLGVKRDLFNKLATNRLADDRDLQQRYEISQGVVPWEDHFGFTMKRLKKTKPVPPQQPQPLGHYRK
jgi:hypothetical protein